MVRQLLFNIQGVVLSPVSITRLPLVLCAVLLPEFPAAATAAAGASSALAVYLEVPEGATARTELGLSGATLEGEKDTLALGVSPRALKATDLRGRQVLL